MRAPQKVPPLSEREKQELVYWLFNVLPQQILLLRQGELTPSWEQECNSIIEAAWKATQKRPRKWEFLVTHVNLYIAAYGYRDRPKAVLRACEQMTKEAPEKYGRSPEALRSRYY